MLKTIFVFTICLFFFSCNKENSPTQKVESPKTETQENENDLDTVMTVEEAFSTALVQGIAGEDEDNDLQLYLEEQVYPIVLKSNKITLDRISSSLYLLSYDEGGIMKNLLIQKYYNPVKDEFFFEKTETQTNAARRYLNYDKMKE